ncbi:hypothetical protein E2C01_095000 [Portunus trituberculatus]|uniref:Uncharacterized protein n=1 Tax=Portunus trituberculatus TaxID=210409 RepID=A0A5B7K2E5_PORTR|nr:hypothetical protein [Portunus trituberculatus]
MCPRGVTAAVRPARLVLTVTMKTPHPNDEFDRIHTVSVHGKTPRSGSWRPIAVHEPLYTPHTWTGNTY